MDFLDKHSVTAFAHNVTEKHESVFDQTNAFVVVCGILHDNSPNLLKRTVQVNVFEHELAAKQFLF